MGADATVGIALVAAGLADCAVALLFTGRRVPDERQRRLVVGAMVSGGVLMILLGGAIAAGVLGPDHRAP